MAITEQFTVKVQVSEMVKKRTIIDIVRWVLHLKFEYYNQIHCFKGTAFKIHENSCENKVQTQIYINVW